MRRAQLGEIAVVLAFLALAALVFQQTSTSFVEQGAASGGAMFNAAMFPDLLAWGLVLLSAIQLVGIIRVVVAGTATDPSADSVAAAGAEPADQERKLTIALVCAALFVLYLFLLRPLGYHLTTPVFLSAFYYVLGTRQILVAIGLGVATSLGMSLVFEYWMNVILPVGMFGIGF